MAVIPNSLVVTQAFAFSTPRSFYASTGPINGGPHLRCAHVLPHFDGYGSRDYPLQRTWLAGGAMGVIPCGFRWARAAMSYHDIMIYHVIFENPVLEMT